MLECTTVCIGYGIRSICIVIGPNLKLPPFQSWSEHISNWGENNFYNSVMPSKIRETGRRLFFFAVRSSCLFIALIWQDAIYLDQRCFAPREAVREWNRNRILILEIPPSRYISECKQEEERSREPSKKGVFCLPKGFHWLWWTHHRFRTWLFHFRRTVWGCALLVRFGSSGCRHLSVNKRIWRW